MISKTVYMTLAFSLFVISDIAFGWEAIGHKSKGCPDGYYKDGLLGTCLPKIGGSVGKAAEDLKKGIQQSPVVKGLERLGTEVFGEVGAPILAAWISASREEAISKGTFPIPPQIRSQLTGYFPENILNRTRYRTGKGGELSLARNSINFGGAGAIALYDVIVFKNPHDVNHNPVLWAHELTHVQQYERWGGIHGFSRRYMKNHKAVEDEAYRNQNKYLAWKNYGNGNPRSASFSSLGSSVGRTMPNTPTRPTQNNLVTSNNFHITYSCKIMGGPRTGQQLYFDPKVYPWVIPIIIGGYCQDGLGNWGYGVKTDHNSIRF